MHGVEGSKGEEERGKDEGLDQADDHFQHHEWQRYQWTDQNKGDQQDDFAAENVAEKTQGQGGGTDNFRNDVQQAGEKVDNAHRAFCDNGFDVDKMPQIAEYAVCFEALVFEIEKGGDGQAGRGIEVAGWCAEKFGLFDNRSHEQSQPVGAEDDQKETDEGHKVFFCAGSTDVLHEVI